MKLMPLTAGRVCVSPVCSRTWTTAHVGAQLCPFCFTPQPNVAHAWPHCCPRGHSTMSGGNCGECAAIEALKPGAIAVARTPTWRDRT